VWNEEVEFEIRDKRLVASTLRLTLYNDDLKSGHPMEIGYEEFMFPLLFYNGHGIKDHFFVFKNDLAVGKVLLQTSYEPFPPEPPSEPSPPLVPKDSLLMEEEVPPIKRKKRKKKKAPPKPKPDWDHRFWVDGISNLDRTHPYFKVYFDSPPRGSNGSRSNSNTKVLNNSISDASKFKQLSQSPVGPPQFMPINLDSRVQVVGQDLNDKSSDGRILAAGSKINNESVK
jgi:hypothetical protein